MQGEEPLSSSVSSSSWSELPKDLVVGISELLIIKNPYVDYVRFSLVCKSWYSFLPNKPYHKYPVLISPYILGRYDQHSHRYDKNTQRNGIFGMAKDDNDNTNAKHNKLYHLSDLLDHQFVLSNSIIKGSSSHGWLVMMVTSQEASSYRHTYLYNPFTNAKLSLPPIPDDHIRKVVLSSTPPPTMVAIAICCNPSLCDSHHADNLFIARPGDNAWTNLRVNRSHEEGKENYRFEDVLFCGNKIYALQCNLKICVFNMDDHLQIDPSPCSFILESHHDFDYYWPMPWVEYTGFYIFDVHLVGSPFHDSVLMIVVQEIKTHAVYHPSYGFRESEGRRETVGFRVFKWESESKRWIRVKNLGEDQMLFIGPVSSFCLSSNTNGSHDDAFPGFRGNCIYFIGYYYNSRTNITSNYEKGIFSLEDDCIHEFSSSSLPIQCDTGDKYYIPIPCSTPPAWLTYTCH